jgi:hypothetical protein
VTIPSGTAALLVGSYRYESVAPLTLKAGSSYLVGAYFGPVASICGSACGDWLLLNGTENYAAGITFGDSRVSQATSGAGSLARPDLAATSNEGVFGPNFLLAATIQTVTPEPSSLPLAGVGIGVFLVGAFRRRHV